MADNSRPLGAQLSHMLSDRGVDVIFGIPGVHNQEMYRGIEEAGITHVLARHEQGAGFMADGYARATGKPGVAYVITGPGLCNILTPLGQAYSDSVPVLVISSCLDETAARRGQLHQMKDQRGAAETVCGWSEEARTPEAAYALIDRALAETRFERPRPKHIQVPIGLLEATAPEGWNRGHSTDIGRADRAETQALAERLAAAQRPVFVFGGGAVGAARSAPQLISGLLSRFGAAAFTTYAGRGVVPADYPLSFGSMLARPGSAEVLAEADLIVAVGTSLDEVDIWRRELGHQCPLVRVDIDPEVFRDAQDAQEAVCCDSLAFLQSLSGTTVARKRGTGWTATEVAAARARWRSEVDAEYPGVLPVAEALQACLPEDAMVYSDMTQFAYAALEVWDMPRPGHWHHPFGFGTLGYALPAAIGGAVARRGQPTLAIAGDYGFHYTMAELGVAVELGLSLPILLWDNGKLGAIEASMVGAQIAPNAVIARNPDFVKLAEAFGARATAPRTLADMQRAIAEAWDAEGPTLIHVSPQIAG